MVIFGQYLYYSFIFINFAHYLVAIGKGKNPHLLAIGKGKNPHNDAEI